MLAIRKCPSCGSGKIRLEKKNVSLVSRDERFTVPSLAFYECPNCREKIYDRDAMRKIERHLPAFAKAEAHR